MDDETRAFLSIHKTGSISAAAKELGYSQPAVSKKLKALENRLGVELFRRVAHPLALTEAGMAYIQFAQKERALEIALSENLSQFAVGGHKRLRIGVSEPRCASLLSEPIIQFYERFPKHVVDLEPVESDGQIFELFSEGRIDFVALTPCQPSYGFMQTQVLCKERLQLFASSKYSLLTCDEETPQTVSLKEIARYPFIMPSRAKHLAEILEDVCSQNCINIHTILHSFGNEMTLEMVRRGVGVAILPNTTLAKHVEPSLIRYSIKELPDGIDLNLITQRNSLLSDYDIFFIKLLKQYIKNYF
ncbi:MAG: LysR family transcriptional regulator [Coriobacteriia bacterium]|nr:LysR family transcriptional regulator [Coriobacteriia bacterium]MBS5477632.1 LysR family transcriptional regulator [Coriobacteriia bacterium]